MAFRLKAYRDKGASNNKKASPRTWKALIGHRQSTFLTRGASALHNVESTYSATLSKTLSRQYLFGPLASLDVSGQWPVFMQEPHLTEVNLLYARGKNLSTGEVTGAEAGERLRRRPCIMTNFRQEMPPGNPRATGPASLQSDLLPNILIYLKDEEKPRSAHVAEICTLPAHGGVDRGGMFGFSRVGPSPGGATGETG